MFYNEADTNGRECKHPSIVLRRFSISDLRSAHRSGLQHCTGINVDPSRKAITMRYLDQVKGEIDRRGRERFELVSSSHSSSSSSQR